MKINRFTVWTSWVNLRKYTDVLAIRAEKIQIKGLVVGKKYGIILFKDTT